jgi:hypothetical protein
MNTASNLTRTVRPDITSADDERVYDAHCRLISAGFMGYHNLRSINAKGLMGDFLLMVRFGHAQHRPARSGSAFGFIFG